MEVNDDDRCDGWPGGRSGKNRPLVSRIAAAVGAVFLLLGILGFIPGITTHHSEMQFAGHDSYAKLFGARRFLIGGGVVYLVLWLYGLAVGYESTANFVPLNRADNWLHLLLGVSMIALGIGATRGRTRT